MSLGGHYFCFVMFLVFRQVLTCAQVIHRLLQRQLRAFRNQRPSPNNQTRSPTCNPLCRSRVYARQYRVFWRRVQGRYSRKPTDRCVRWAFRILLAINSAELASCRALFFRNLFGPATERVSSIY